VERNGVTGEQVGVITDVNQEILAQWTLGHTNNGVTLVQADGGGIQYGLAAGLEVDPSLTLEQLKNKIQEWLVTNQAAEVGGSLKPDHLADGRDRVSGWSMIVTSQGLVRDRKES